jgi:hypothetical protein
VNLEVVKARARPGADAGAIMAFADAASSELESMTRLAAAMLALGRPGRGAADVARIAADAVALLEPGLRASGVRLELAGDRSAVVAGRPTDVRLAVVTSLLAVVESVRNRAETAEIAGALPASDTAGLVRCTTTSEPRPTLVIAPSLGATLAPDVRDALADAAIGVDSSGDALRLAFPGVLEP